MIRVEFVPPEEAGKLITADTEISRHFRLSEEYMAALNAQDTMFVFVFGMLENEVVSALVIEYPAHGKGKTVNIHVISVSDDTAKEFWSECLEGLRRMKIHSANVLTFGALNTNYPDSRPFTSLIERWEYRIRTEGYSIDSLHPKHRNMVRRSVREGLEFRTSSSATSYGKHVELKVQSMKKRLSRGEDVSIPQEKSFERHLLDSGAAVLYHAFLGEETVSSAMVVLSREGGYLLSAGTSDKGMKIGASNALIFHVASSLDEGRTFNLGGVTREEKGLKRYKERFGGEAIYLPTCLIVLRRSLRRKAASAMRKLVNSPGVFLRDHFISISRYEHYTVDLTEEMDEPALPEITPVSPERDASQLRESFPKVAAKIELYGGAEGAFALRQGEKIAHISWMISSERERAFEEANVLLKSDQVEATHCYTLEEFRGRSLYPRMIRFLMGEAFRNGYSSLHMITSISNIASQKGIQKAGLQRVGRIFRMKLLRFLKKPLIITVRPHRAFLSGMISVGFESH